MYYHKHSKKLGLGKGENGENGGGKEVKWRKGIKGIVCVLDYCVYHLSQINILGTIVYFGLL